jgi:hypothetical protein
MWRIDEFQLEFKKQNEKWWFILWQDKDWVDIIEQLNISSGYAIRDKKNTNDSFKGIIERADEMNNANKPDDGKKHRTLTDIKWFSDADRYEIAVTTIYWLWPMYQTKLFDYILKK